MKGTMSPEFDDVPDDDDDVPDELVVLSVV